MRAARDAGLYTNLITSAWHLTHERLSALADAGLDHVQVSLQDSDAGRADRIAGTTVHAHKLEAARWVKPLGMALSVNAVLHLQNLPFVGEIIALAESLGASGWSSPTPSGTAAPSCTGTRCCPTGRPWRARAPSPSPSGSGCEGRWM